MTRKTYAIGIATGVVSLLAGIVIALVGGGSLVNGEGLQGNLAASTQQAQQHFFVDPAKVPQDYCNDIVAAHGGKLVTMKDGSKTPYFDTGSTHPEVGGYNPDHLVPRLYPDATDVPLPSPQNLAAEQYETCFRPDQAAMEMNGIGAGVIGGKSIAQINSAWMQAQGSPSVIAPWAQACLTDDVDTHLACAKTMSYTAYLLGLFQSSGVHLVRTAWNIHLAGPRVGAVPPFSLNSKQEHGYFLVISWTEKTGGCFLKYGFNVGVSTINGGDQRLAGLSCVPPKESTPSHTPPGSRPPGHTTPPSTPGTTPPGHPHTTPPSSHSCTPCGQCSGPCISLSSGSQVVPTPKHGASGVSTGGNGPPNTGKGNSPTPTAPGGKPSGPTGSAVPSQPGGGGNNSSSVPPPPPSSGSNCGPLSATYCPGP